MTEHSTKSITAVIPLRLVPGVYEGEERLGRLMSTIPADVYEILVVDYGSKRPEADAIARICERHEHARVVRVPGVEDKIFSIGAARDIGAQHARAPVVIFNDIDFHAPEEGYRRIAAEVHARRIASCAYNFFCVPVVFLTEEGSRAYWADDEPAAMMHRIHTAVTTYETDLIEFTSYGSSAMVVNKHHYLSIGGHSPEFFGHGAEDFDVLHRLASYYQRGPRPRDYYRDLKSNQVTDYTGFRAYFALYGLDVFQRGTFLVHDWHPKRTMKNYMQSSRNFSILTRLMREFDRDRKQPPALEDAASSRRTLLLADPTSRACRSLRHAMPLMGRLVIRPEALFPTPESLQQFVFSENIDVVGFLNPYGNEHRERLYQAVRTAGIPYWTFDRGALPDSWFFDPSGFNFDSSSYERDRWDAELAPADAGHVRETLESLRQSASTLEANGPRFTPRHWRSVLGLGDRKVLFVPLQRPRDTVVRYFSGDCGDYDGFAAWVRHVASQLDPRHWVVLAKRHPLEDEQIDLGDRVQYVPSDAHIHDLLELADRVMLLNSGTGVLAMAFSTPTIVCGDAFYAHEGLNWKAHSREEALALVQDDSLSVSADAVERFYHHLLRRVYSFGKARYVDRTDEANRRIRISEEIVFSEIRGLTDAEVVLGEADRGVSLDAPLFYSFGGRDGVLHTRDGGLSTQFSSRRKQLVAQVVSPFVTSERLSRKLKRDPERFFADSKNPVVRGLGRILL